MPASSGKAVWRAASHRTPKDLSPHAKTRGRAATAFHAMTGDGERNLGWYVNKPHFGLRRQAQRDAALLGSIDECRFDR